MRVLPALADADGLALVELDAAHRVARRALRAAHPAARRLLRCRRAARDRARGASRLSSTTRTRCGCSSARDLERPLEVFVKINTGMNRLGVRAGATSRASSSGSTHCDSVAVLRLMTHLARADEEDGIEEHARDVRRGVPRLAVSALDRQFGGRRALRRGRRRHRAPGNHALRRDAVSVRHRGDDRRAAGDDAALADHRRAGRCRPNDSVGYGARLHGVARAPDRRRRLRLRRRLSAARAERHAGARVRQEGAPGGPRVDGHDHRRSHRRAGSAASAARSCSGARDCRSTTSRAPRRPSATSCCARVAPRVPFVDDQRRRAIDLEL